MKSVAAFYTLHSTTTIKLYYNYFVNIVIAFGLHRQSVVSHRQTVNNEDNYTTTVSSATKQHCRWSAVNDDDDDYQQHQQSSIVQQTSSAVRGSPQQRKHDGSEASITAKTTTTTIQQPTKLYLKIYISTTACTQRVSRASQWGRQQQRL